MTWKSWQYLPSGWSVNGFFDWVFYNLLIAKCSEYEFNGNALKYIYIYLEIDKQCVCIKNLNTCFKGIIFEVSLNSIAEPILNVFLSDFFVYIRIASVHNYADHSSLFSPEKCVTFFVKILITGQVSF